jgi:hypothetical protein
MKVKLIPLLSLKFQRLKKILPVSIKLQTYSPICKAWHSRIKELGLDTVAKMTPWKKKLGDRIQSRESVVYKLRKNYMTKNL